MNRGLGAILAGIAGGANSYADARISREQREAEERARREASARAAEQLAMQRTSAEREAAYQAATLAETRRQHDVGAAQGFLDRGAVLLPRNAPTAQQFADTMDTATPGGLPADMRERFAQLLAPRFGGADRNVVGQLGDSDVVFTETPQARDTRRLREADRIKDENDRGGREERYRAYVAAGLSEAKARAAAINPSLADNFLFPKADPFALIAARQAASEGARDERDDRRQHETDVRAARVDRRHAEGEFASMLRRRPRQAQHVDPLTRMADTAAFNEAMTDWRADSSARADRVGEAQSALDELLGARAPAPGAKPAGHVGGQNFPMTPERQEYNDVVFKILGSALPEAEKQRRIKVATERFQASQRR